MEGGDDVTLDPGEIVRLVSVESGGVLRVRTTDEPSSEGKILASYLRKKDSIKGLKMEGPLLTFVPLVVVTTHLLFVYSYSQVHYASF